jgi:hypothetical protein
MPIAILVKVERGMGERGMMVSLENYFASETSLCLNVNEVILLRPNLT